MSQDIDDRVRHIVARKLHRSAADIRADADFVADLDADSLEIVELVVDMEREFDIRIPDDEAEKIRTVADAVSFVRSRLT
jgi:acyl carrier protein